MRSNYSWLDNEVGTYWMTENQETYLLLYAARILINQHGSLQEEKVFCSFADLSNSGLR